MTEIDLGWWAFASLFVVSALCGVGILLVFRRWSDQEAIRRSRSLIMAHLLEFRLFLDDPRLILRAQRALIVENLRLMRLLLWPVLIITVPMLILFEPLDSIYRHAPLKVGEPAVATVRLRNVTPMQLRTPYGFVVETPPVQVPSEHEVSWRIRPLRPAAGLLEVSGPKRVFTKRVRAGIGGLHYLEGRSRFLFDKDVAWIEVPYPLATVLQLHWAVWFFLISSITALALRKRFGATF